MKKTVVEIQNLCRQIVENFNPQKIILFGSHAYDEPSSDSDVDLLVVMDFDGRGVEQAIKIRQSISGKMALDLLVRTPAQIEERLSLGDFFVKEITERGRVLYEADNAGMD
jgi:predicted nucleotidyltransferase